MDSKQANGYSPTTSWLRIGVTGIVFGRRYNADFSHFDIDYFTF